MLAACEATSDSTGSWKPPIAVVPDNPSYPSCAASMECHWGERCDGPSSTCTADGAGLVAAPDFTLPDEDEHSATYGQDVSLSAQHGLVTVIYFGLSTCPVCWQQVMRVQSTLETLADGGLGNVTALVIDHESGAGKVWEMAQYTRLPILQDTAGSTVWNLFHAVKDTFVVVDPYGFVRASFATLYPFRSAADLARLEEAIRDAAK